MIPSKVLYGYGYCNNRGTSAVAPRTRPRASAFPAAACTMEEEMRAPQPRVDDATAAANAEEHKRKRGGLDDALYAEVVLYPNVISLVSSMPVNNVGVIAR